MEIIRSEDRGFKDHGWLQTYHTFSFAEYHNPERMQFGMLRVLNDDVVKPGQGFGTHPHENMEIISIPLAGNLAHKDSTGKEGVISTGEIQVMTAGTGIMHSERNPGPGNVNFLQLWIFPEESNLKPTYSQKKFNEPGWNIIQLLVSPDSKEGSLKIHQKAFLSRLSLEGGKTFIYEQHNADNGVLLFVLEGRIRINNSDLDRRDTTLLDPVESVIINAAKNSHLLFVEVPMV